MSYLQLEYLIKTVNIFFVVVLLLCKQIVESARVKMRKPEARIYHYILEKLQVAPQEIVFLDDLGENLKAAKQLGIRTIKVHKTV